MLLKVLKSKLHRARVTDAKLHYPGSIEIDKSLMQAAGILPYESVLVANLNNGNRFETYVVPGEADSGNVVILGAAAQLAGPGDVVIIMAFAYCTPEEAAGLAPKVVVLDDKNRIAKQR
jgi:aspartate 1-decarboxylase